MVFPKTRPRQVGEGQVAVKSPILAWRTDLGRAASQLAAGVSDKLWALEDIAEPIEANWPQPGKRGPYKKAVR